MCFVQKPVVCSYLILFCDHTHIFNSKGVVGAAFQFRYSLPGRGMVEVTSSPGESEGLPGGRGELSDRQDCESEEERERDKDWDLSEEEKEFSIVWQQASDGEVSNECDNWEDAN